MKTVMTCTFMLVRHSLIRCKQTNKMFTTHLRMLPCFLLEFGSKLFCLLSERRSTLKGKNLWRQFLPFRIDFFLEWTMRPRKNITKIRLYNFDPHPLKPLLYSKTGVYRGSFLILLKKKHRLWVLIRRKNPLAEAVLTSNHNLCFEREYEK